MVGKVFVPTLDSGNSHICMMYLSAVSRHKYSFSGLVFHAAEEL